MQLTKEELINVNEFIVQINKSSQKAAVKALEAMDISRNAWAKTLRALRSEIDNYTPTDETGQSECGDCGEVWADDDIKSLCDIHHLWERISPGGTVPSGECPGVDCGALCYPTDKPATKKREDKDSEEVGA